MSTITIKTTVAADPELTWKCYTDPEHITKWNFASEDWCCPNAENDLTVGGVYKARMEAKDGSFGFDFEAVYSKVDEPNSLSYTMPDSRVVTTSFQSDSGSTLVTTVFDAETENDEEMQRNGWQAILDNFKKHVESLTA